MRVRLRRQPLDVDCKPAMDRYGLGGCRCEFGSAHPTGFIMAFCDGSVRRTSFFLDAKVHQYLGNRKDGVAVDLTKY